MFVDHVEIEVAAGSGGNGAATFRREKYVPHGGPNGGDGGRGGSVVMEVDPNLSTLLEFRYKRHYTAPRGVDGMRKDMFGKDGSNLVLRVPPGTQVYNMDTNELIADLTEPGEKATIAKGGAGGRGNTHFANSVQQAPKFAENGEPGEVRKLKLELKLLADVGLLGFPSVGKSTLIAAVSAARPKIADYPFTTLAPNLGVVAVEQQKSFIMADLPGLIEGAHEGVGLGHQFLRHAERTLALVHILDVCGLTGRDPLEDFRIINNELVHYSDRLAALPQIVALNKMDVAPDIEEVDRIETVLKDAGYDVYRISAATRQGLQPLLYAIWNLLEIARTNSPELQKKIVEIKAEPREDIRNWTAVHQPTGEWVVTGKGLERLVAMTNLQNEEGVRRLQRTLERINFNKRMRELGVKDGDTVRVGQAEFDFDEEDREEDDN